MKVFITGVAGETGSVVSDKLLQSGKYEVVGIDDLSDGSLRNLPRSIKSDNFQFLEGDITHLRDGVFPLTSGGSFDLRAYDPDIVINMAAKVTTKYFYNNPDLTFKVNCQGAIDIFDEVVELSKRRVEQGRSKVKFINASTSEVYGHGSGRWDWTEDTISTYDSVEDSPRWSYAHGKILTEYYMNHYKDLVDVCHIRYANCYGPRDIEPSHVIPYLIYQGYTGEVANITKDPSKVFRSFLYMEDAADATIALIDGMTSGVAYNVGTQDEISILDLVYTIEDVIDKEIKIDPTLDRPGDPQRRVLNTDRIRLSTGWEPKWSLEDGIREVAKEMKSAYDL